MAPSSYQPPILGDKLAPRTINKSVKSNLSQNKPTVMHVLQGKDVEVFWCSLQLRFTTPSGSLKEKRIGAVIFNDEGSAKSILPELDIVRSMEEVPWQTLPQLVGNLMTRNVETFTAQDLVMDVLKRMSAGRFLYMPHS